MFGILNIPESGELEMIEVYEYYDVPILFACQNAASRLYIVLFADRLPEYEMWLYVEVSAQRFNLIRTGEINLHDTFFKPEMGRLIKAMIPYSDSEKFDSNYITPDQLPSDVFMPTSMRLNLIDNKFYLNHEKNTKAEKK